MADAGWPLLMDAATACRYLSYTRHHFRALVTAGLLPPSREPMPGSPPRWHRGELDRAAARLWNLEVEAANERTKAEAKRALEGYVPPALRRADAQRGR